MAIFAKDKLTKLSELIAAEGSVVLKVISVIEEDYNVSVKVSVSVRPHGAIEEQLISESVYSLSKKDAFVATKSLVSECETRAFGRALSWALNSYGVDTDLLSTDEVNQDTLYLASLINLAKERKLDIGSIPDPALRAAFKVYINSI